MSEHDANALLAGRIIQELATLTPDVREAVWQWNENLRHTMTELDLANYARRQVETQSQERIVQLEAQVARLELADKVARAAWGMDDNCLSDYSESYGMFDDASYRSFHQFRMALDEYRQALAASDEEGG